MTVTVSGRRFRRLPGAVGVVFAATLGAVLTGCGSGSTSTSAATPTPSASSSSDAGVSIASPSESAAPVVEVNPPGDIPDTQLFVPYAGRGYRVVVPEGWARSDTSGGAVFTDKYNRIQVEEKALASAPTPASVLARDLPAIKAQRQGVTGGSASTIQRSAGAAVLLTFRAFSPVDPVTGKVAVEAVERYAFWRAGREVVLTLEGPVGSDNVDPWRKVTQSFTWA